MFDRAQSSAWVRHAAAPLRMGQCLTMSRVLSLLALDREQLMIAALLSLIVASVIVSLGAWILLLKERQAVRRARAAARGTGGPPAIEPSAGRRGRPSTAASP